MKCKFCGKELVGDEICYCIDSLRARNLNIIQCQDCKKELIVPNNKGNLLVMCPRCNAKIKYNPKSATKDLTHPLDDNKNKQMIPTEGDIKWKLFVAGISAISMGIGALLLSQQTKHLLSASNGAIALLSVIVIAGFASTLFFSVMVLKGATDLAKKENKDAYKDAYFLLASCIFLFTLCSWKVIKASMMGINAANGSFSFDMIGDALDIYEGYSWLKISLTIDAILGVIAIICKYIEVSPNKITNQVTETASNVIKSQKDNLKTKNNKSDDDYIEKLKNLKSLLDDGTLTEQEFNELKRRIINM